MQNRLKNLRKLFKRDKDAVERYKAVKMEGKIVEASFKCTSVH